MYKLAVRSVVNGGYATLSKVAAVTSIFEKWGFDYEVMVDRHWSGWASKQKAFINIAKELPEDYTHLMFVDAADIIVLGTPNQIMERWFEFNHPWVYSAEPFIWSPNSFQPEDYPTPDVVYRYLNSGASIGEIGHIKALFDRWTDGFTRLPPCPHGDQDWMAARFIEGYPDAIKLDTGCKLFQSACGSRIGPEPYLEVSPGKIYNRITETFPLVLHANGGDNITGPDWRSLWKS